MLAQRLRPLASTLLKPSPRAQTTTGMTSAETPTTASSLIFSRHGEPLDVLGMQTSEVKPPQGGQACIEMIAAPINPSDINTVQGKYPLQHPQGVGGHEGVGRVVAIGPGTTKLRVGQLVIPLEAAQGTWTTCNNFDEAAWHVVPDDLPIADAATLSINPGTALSMLRDFVDLQPGDVVVQDGANGSVGRYVIAMARARGLHTINIVRDRPDWESTVASLQSAGADIVATPEDARKALKASGLSAPRLALDCVGGQVATTLAKMLAPSGTLVNYGAMGMAPVAVPAPLLIFKDIRVRGFWISGRRSEELGLQGKARLMDELVRLVQQGVIRAECQEVAFHEWQDAFNTLVNRQSRTTKILLRMH